MRSFLIEKESTKSTPPHPEHHDHEHHDHSHDHSHEHGHDHEHGAVNIRLLLVALAIFALGVIVGRMELSVGPLSDTMLKSILFLVAYLLAGHKTILIAFKNMGKGEFFDESFLMTIATFGALGLREFPEAAAVMLFYQVGEYFQGRAVARSRRSISDLMDIRPDFANIVREDGTSEVIDPDELEIGDIILIKSGEKIPVDATIVEGFTTIDNAALTGESIPVEKVVGDSMMSGAINLTGLVKARVDKRFEESTVGKILELVQNASEKKSNQERFITRFSKFYTPIVVALAVLVAIIPPLFFAEPFSKWISRALIFLVVSCPCALVISVPLSFFAGIGGASKRGILFKGSSYVEQLSQVKTVMLDKTGTLTKGEFEVSEILPFNGLSADELLELAAYAEQSSNHPIAKSIVREYLQKTKKIFDPNRASSVQEMSGFGVSAKIDGREILAGNQKLLAERQVELKAPSASTAVYVAVDGKFVGTITIEDKVKSDAKEAIESLNKEGIKTVILTGDNSQIAQRIAGELGVSQVHAELLPQDKVQKVEAELEIIAREEKSRKVAFVGDGINDAPVLARADLGIAMGGIGSDAAIEAADVVLMTDEPSKISEAIRISQKTMSVAKQNILFALGIKILVMILGVLGIANMWLAVFADVGVTILAVFNAMRAYNVKSQTVS
ncbi:MAG: heavy metal translocating P-type ATPase [Peptostreptococcaceae bacterium]|nr:heavy metal translocating P-type ATPase [Peptostreptococcaceae bacterium]